MNDKIIEQIDRMRKQYDNGQIYYQELDKLEKLLSELKSQYRKQGFEAAREKEIKEIGCPLCNYGCDLCNDGLITICNDKYPTPEDYLKEENK